MSLLNGGGVVGLIAVALLDAGMTTIQILLTRMVKKKTRFCKASCVVAFTFHNMCVHVRVFLCLCVCVALCCGTQQVGLGVFGVTHQETGLRLSLWEWATASVTAFRWNLYLCLCMHVCTCQCVSGGVTGESV